MTLRLAQLVDESTIVSESPLVFGLTGRRIEGARSVLEWIVRSWFQPRGRNRISPNATVDIRDLENATFDAQGRTLERWRADMVAAARAASIGYLRGLELSLAHADRTTTIRSAVALVDGSTHRLAVTIGAAGAVLTFGGGS